jgi:hypothetical protein
MTYGLRVASSDTGRVLYDQHMAIDFFHHQCGNVTPCLQADVKLPDATINLPDAGGL